MQNLSEKRIGIVIVGGTIRDIYAFFLAQGAVYIVKSYMICKKVIGKEKYRYGEIT